MRIQNLGSVLSILAHAECAEHFMHADISAFGAPSECHALVSRGEAKRRRIVRKRVEAEARAPLRVIVQQAKKRGMPLGSHKWHRFISRVYTRHYPF